MIVHISKLRPGDRLAVDTFNSQGLFVLSKGAQLTEYDLSQLNHHQIEQVDIVPRTSSALSPKTSDRSTLQIHEQFALLYQDAVAGFEHLFSQALAEGKISDPDLQSSFQPLIDNCKLERDIVSLLLVLDSQDDYTCQHSVQVGMLSYYIAGWLGWGESLSLLAGKAGFLHDIGKCRIPDQILNKPGKLTSSEYTEIKNHSRYGYDILQNSATDPIVSLAALQHHERMDGSGYPNRINGRAIHLVSRIVAVADTYSAMISKRVYQEERDLLFVLKELHYASFGELDPEITHTFIRHMLPNFIGKQVELSDGTVGMIVMNHPTEHFRPLVQTAKGFIDLHAMRRLEITKVHL